MERAREICGQRSSIIFLLPSSSSCSILCVCMRIFLQRSTLWPVFESKRHLRDRELNKMRQSPSLDTKSRHSQCESSLFFIAKVCLFVLRRWRRCFPPFMVNQNTFKRETAKPLFVSTTRERDKMAISDT
jgi:hypothetical protein